MTDFFGGGLVFAVAAALWIAYLIPSWIRRRNFNAVEHNVARSKVALGDFIQGSAPSMAQTVNESLETSRERKRSLLAAERIARAQLHAEQKAVKAQRSEERLAVAKHRRRTWRLVAFILVVVSVLASLAGIALVDYTGNPALLYGGLGGFMGGLLAISLLSARGRKAVHAEVQASQSAPLFDFQPSFDAEQTRSWTPQPLPRPMHLQAGSLAQATVAQVSMAERIRQAAREEALRARIDTAAEIAFAQSVVQADAVRVPQAAATVVPVADVTSLGALTDPQTMPLDLDEVFRRRAAG